MAIDRAKLQDEAKVVRAIQEDAPDVKRHLENHKKSVDDLWDEFVKLTGEQSKYTQAVDQMLKESRTGVTMSEKKLKELRKDKRGNKEKIESMQKVKKYFSDTGTFAKKAKKSMGG